MRTVPWTEADIALLRGRFADSRTDDLARALGRSYSTVAQKAAKLGLRKSAAYLASPDAHRLDGIKGLRTRIQPGATPWNKGRPGSTGTQPGCRATQFKPGGMSGAAQHNYVPIGSLRITKDGLLERKLNDSHPVPARRWVAVHRLVWIEAHGDIPAEHVVVFRPGRKTTDLQMIVADGLELLTRAQNMRRNSVHSRYPPEVARLVQLRGAITRQINSKAKEAEKT